MSEIMKVIPIGEAGEHMYHRDDDTEVAGLNLNRLLCLLFEEIPTRMADGLETAKRGDWHANRHNYWSFDDLDVFFASTPYKFNPPGPDIEAIARAVRLVYRVDTGLRLGLESRAMLTEAIANAWGKNLEKIPQRITDDDFQKVLTSTRIPIDGQEYTGILQMLSKHAPELPRRLAPIPADTLTLDELPSTTRQTSRDSLKQAQATGLRLWAHLDASAELVDSDPLILTDPLEPLFTGRIDVDFSGLVALNPVCIQALLDRGWAPLQGVLGFAGGAIVYRGEPKTVTLEHVRVLASEIQAKSNTQPEELSKKIPANQRHAAAIREELARLGFSEPLQSQKGRGGRGLRDELRPKKKEFRFGLSQSQFDDGWKLIEKV